MNPVALKRMVEMGIPDIGFAKYEAEIPDSLENEFNAWIIAASVLAVSAEGQAALLDHMDMSDVRMGSKTTHQQVISQSTTVPSNYGEVKVSYSYDYDKVPKGLTIID